MDLRFSSQTHEISVNLIRRFWAPVVILVMVAIHAAVIGYVRSRVNRLSNLQVNSVEIGHLRFQNVGEPNSTYQFRLHAIVDPSHHFRGQQALTLAQMEIIESAEQMLRQVDVKWLADPSQKEIRERLMDAVLQHLDEPLVQRVLITDWLRVPAGSTTSPML